MNCIIGCAVNYNWSDLWPLVKSTPGQIVLLVGDDTTPATISILEEHGVIVLPCTMKRGEPPFLDPWVCDLDILQPWHLGRMRLVCARFAAIYAYLRRHGNKFDSVLLTDTRDVISLGDIWQHPWPHAINLFREWEGVKIGQCPYNSAAIRDHYGPGMLNEMKERPIICSGSILGPVTLVVAFLEAMLTEFAGINCQRPGIIDQGVTNVLAFRNHLPFHEWDNEDSPIYNIGYMPAGTPKMDGRLMVHQYDRWQHKELSEALLSAI
jgi:hypothetical protein